MTINEVMTCVYLGVVILVNLITMIAVIKKRKDETPKEEQGTDKEIEIVKEELNNCIGNIKKALIENGIEFKNKAVKKEIKKVL